MVHDTRRGMRQENAPPESFKLTTLGGAFVEQKKDNEHKVIQYFRIKFETSRLNFRLFNKWFERNELRCLDI